MKIEKRQKRIERLLEDIDLHSQQLTSLLKTETPKTRSENSWKAIQRSIEVSRDQLRAAIVTIATT